MSTQTQERREVPYGKRVKEYKYGHRRAVHPMCDHHRIPETAEQIARTERLTQKLKALVHDTDFVLYENDFVSIAERMMDWGHITEEQFFDVDQEYHRVLLENDPEKLALFGYTPA